MKSLFVRGINAIQAWWHWSLRLAGDGSIADQNVSAKGGSFWFSSAACSTHAPTIQRAIHPTITGIDTVMETNKPKPSIVRVIRTIRIRDRQHHLAGDSRLLAELTGRKIANG